MDSLSEDPAVKHTEGIAGTRKEFFSKCMNKEVQSIESDCMFSRDSCQEE